MAFSISIATVIIKVVQYDKCYKVYFRVSLPVFVIVLEQKRNTHHFQQIDINRQVKKQQYYSIYPSHVDVYKPTKEFWINSEF